MLHKGGCACKEVRYEITADPLRMINCHCRDCQRATGSAYAPLLVFPADSVRVMGDLRYFAVTSERGSKVERGFCPNCDNPVLVKIDDRPDKLYVLAASLDDPSLLGLKRTVGCAAQLHGIMWTPTSRHSKYVDGGC
jgi:hypothetical protein